MADIIEVLIGHKRQIDFQFLQIYSGPRFIVADIASKLGEILKQPVIMVIRGGNLHKFMVRYPRWTCPVLRRAEALFAPSAFLAHALTTYNFQV